MYKARPPAGAIEAGRLERDRIGRRLNERRIKPFLLHTHGLDIQAASRVGDAGRLTGCKQHGRGRRGPAARHAASTGTIAVAAGAVTARRNFDRLHPQKRGATQGKEEPRQALHTAIRVCPRPITGNSLYSECRPSLRIAIALGYEVASRPATPPNRSQGRRRKEMGRLSGKLAPWWPASYLSSGALCRFFRGPDVHAAHGHGPVDETGGVLAKISRCGPRHSLEALVKVVVHLAQAESGFPEQLVLLLLPEHL